MTDHPTDTSTTDPGAQGVTDSVKEGVSGTASQAADSTGEVVGTARSETSEVVSTAVGSARDLLHQARGELTEQAGTQHERITGGLHSLADQLDTMHEGADSGLAASLVKQVSERARTAADWMGQREPADLVDEARRYAARKPGTFLAGAAAIGFLGARLTRGLGAAAKADAAPDATAPVQAPSGPTPVEPGAALGDDLPTVTTTSHGQPVTYTSGAGIPGSLDDLGARA